MYRDPGQPAVASAAAIPDPLHSFAYDALQQLLQDTVVLQRALGEYLTEPKAQVWFDAGDPAYQDGPLHLDRKTRMMYDKQHVFINGECFRAGGRDARLMRRLADDRRLDAHALRQASVGARDMLQEWGKAGWLHGD